MRGAVVTASRLYLLWVRWLCELRERQCLAAASRWQQRRATVLAELATEDEVELQMWDRQ